MRGVSLIVFCAAVFFSEIESRADGLIFQLPPDGAWARYRYQTKGEAQPDGADRQEFDFKGRLTLSSVGRVVVDDKECRWIEVKLDVDVPGGPEGQGHVLKVLIPEKNLKRGEDPLAHVLRIYYRGGASRKTERIEEAWRKRYEIERFRPLFPKPLEHIKRLSARTLETKMGKIECECISGKTELPPAPLRGGAEWAWKAEVEHCLSSKSPFGVVEVRSKRTGYETTGGTTNIVTTKLKSTETLNLVDFGREAVSELPDAK